MQAGAGVVWHARPGDEVTEGAAAVHPAHRRAEPLRPGAGRRSRAGSTVGDGVVVRADAAAARPGRRCIGAGQRSGSGSGPGRRCRAGSGLPVGATEVSTRYRRQSLRPRPACSRSATDRPLAEPARDVDRARAPEADAAALDADEGVVPAGGEAQPGQLGLRHSTGGGAGPRRSTPTPDADDAPWSRRMTAPGSARGRPGGGVRLRADRGPGRRHDRAGEPAGRTTRWPGLRRGRRRRTCALAARQHRRRRRLALWARLGRCPACRGRGAYAPCVARSAARRPRGTTARFGLVKPVDAPWPSSSDARRRHAGTAEQRC